MDSVAQRDANGKFLPGHRGLSPGRPRGKRNGVLMDMRQVKAEVIQSWQDCHGRDILNALSKTDPDRWLRIVLSVLPKELFIEVDHEITVYTHDPLAARLFRQRADEIARERGLSGPALIELVLAEEDSEFVEFQAMRKNKGLQHTPGNLLEVSQPRLQTVDRTVSGD